jgi:hypothetical protein
MIFDFRTFCLPLAMFLITGQPSPSQTADPFLLTIDSDGGLHSTAFTRAMFDRLPHVRVRTATPWTSPDTGLKGVPNRDLLAAAHLSRTEIDVQASVR